MKHTTKNQKLTTPIIALALGTMTMLSAITPVANAATESGFTGGIRSENNNQGAIEKDQQKPSDLPDGSCVVESGAPSGSQSGFTWNTLDPNTQTPVEEQKDWGVSVAFDNSKDRTFSDWSFGNSGNYGTLLNTGSVSSMNAGTDFPVVPPLEVTAKADENIKITAARQQRNLNLFAELTKEKVKQFADAGAENPVRYAWVGTYTTENPKGPKATKGFHC